MSILFSVIESNSPQTNGSRYVTEAHTDHLGVIRRVTALRDATVDDNAELARHASQMPVELRAQEQQTNLGAILTDGATAVLTFNHGTPTQFRTFLRDAYRDATRRDAVFIGDFLNSLTDAQLQAIFGKTLLEVQALRLSRFGPAADTAAKIKAADGM